MRGKPEHLNAEYAAQAAASRDKYASERESYRAEAEQDVTADAYEHEHAANVLTEDERFAFQAGHTVGERTERARIKAGLGALERDTAPLFVEGTAAARAAAGFVAAVRRVVNGEGDKT